MDPRTETEAMAWDVLHGVIDPEVGINIVDLGLVYGIEAEDDAVRVIMTLTTPGCPLHETIAEAVDTSLRYFISDIESVSVDLVWDPPWSPSMITAAGREELGWR
ncbi:MAG: metal-sulfur cluster assembly factor [Thermomicrobiales bacterium]|nr:MAG: metal-sulfur cluster assembly factor [Thermomicrobiales bacterium]